jgi:poly(3-hydroxyalkanoate) depolymerase
MWPTAHDLRVTSEGEGRPLLLVNGIGATGDLFEPFRRALAERDGRQTITFDAPGVGGSPTPWYPPTMRQLAELVACLIERLGHEAVDVLGISWGGALAQELARRYPERVRRLVLVATMHGWTSFPGRPTAIAVLATPARYYSTTYLKLVAPTLYGREILDHPELLRRHGYLRTQRPPSPIGYTWQLAALRRWTSLPWLRSLPQPTLVLAGDADPIIPLINAHVLAERIPGGELHVVRGGGHLFLYLRAGEMAERVTTFLDGQP